MNEWGRHKARERYDSGGNVEPLRLSPDEMLTRVNRLKGAGILNRDAAKDFVDARLKRLGIDPTQYGSQPAKYDSGGKVA